MPETNFFWDPLSDNILQERDETGTVTAEYTTEPGLYGNLISQSREGVESQYHFDALGSTLALTDDNQQVTDSQAYSAFGVTTEHTGSTVNHFQYVGKNEYYKDELTGEYSGRTQNLDADTGRWLSFELLLHETLNGYPFGFDGALNLTQTTPSNEDVPQPGNQNGDGNTGKAASVETEMKCPQPVEACKDQTCWWRQTISASGSPVQVCVDWQKGILTVGMTVICCNVDRMWGSGYISVTLKGEKPCVVKTPVPGELKRCGVILKFPEGDPPDANPTRSIGFCVKGTTEKPLESVKFVSQLKLTCKCDDTTSRKNWKTQLDWSSDGGNSGRELPNPDAPVLAPE